MLIVLGYKKFSGKDSVANRLVDKWQFKKLHLADPVKEACRLLYCLDDEQLYGSKKETVDPRWNKTPRQLFQLLAEDCCRNIIDPLTLEKSLSYKYDLQKNNYVIADVRKIESVLFLKDLGSYTWKINRPSLPNTDTHISETSLDAFTGWDIQLENDKDLGSLYQKTDTALLKLRDKNDNNKRKIKGIRHT
jgi:hypothetical protein